MEVNENSSFHYYLYENTSSQSKLSGISAARLLHTAALLDYYYTPLLCFLGVMGNCLSVTVFCINANHRSLSSSYYLSALAISDTGFLINLFVLWLDGMGVGVLSTNFGCPFVMFSGQVTCFLSVWLTVAFTVERYFAVCSPLTRPRICTVSKAKKVIFGLISFSCIAFSYVLFIARVMPSNEVFYNEKSYYNNSKEQNQFINPLEEAKTSESSFDPLHQSESDGMGIIEKSYEGQETFEGFISPELDTSPMGFDMLHTFGPPLSLINNTKLTLGMINESMARESNLEESTYLMCTVPFQYLTVSIVANYLDSMITLIIPFCLIAFFNIRISVCVWKLKDERKSIMAIPKINNVGKRTTSSYQNAIRTKDPNVQLGESDNKQRNRQCGKSKEQQKSKSGNVITQVCTCGSIFQQSDSLKGSLESSTTNEQINALPSCENSLNTKANCCQKETLTHIVDNENDFKTETLNDPSTSQRHGRDDLGKSVSIWGKSQPNTELNFISLNQRHMSFSPSQLNENASSTISGKIRGGKIKGKVSSTYSSSSEMRVTKMLLLVSTFFLVLNLPSHLFRALAFIQKSLWEDDIEGQNRLHAAQQLSNILLFNTNFAVNFLLYCLSGGNFRKSLKNIFTQSGKNRALKSISRKSTVVNAVRKNTQRRTDNETVFIDEETIGERLNLFSPVRQQRQQIMEETCA